MTNQIQQFHSSEFGTLEILTTDGKPYFPATDCAKILGYSRPHNAVERHCPHSLKRGVGVKTGCKADGSPATQTIEKTFIPEGDLYRLIIRSKLPAAIRFETWVFDTVLPSIRAHGAYITDVVLKAAEQSQEFASELFRKLREERAVNETLRDEVETLSPKARYYDLILQSENAIPISVIAQDYGMSAQKLNSMLNYLGVQYRVGGTWVLYREFAGLGYTQTRTYYKSGGISVMHTSWTQKGRKFLYEMLNGYGILPLMETEGISY